MNPAWLIMDLKTSMDEYYASDSPQNERFSLLNACAFQSVGSTRPTHLDIYLPQPG